LREGTKDKVMAMTSRLKPVHPGEILREEFMRPLGLSANRLALELRVPVTRMAEIVHGRRAITPETALRLGRLFGTTAEFWVNLQTRYDLEMTRDQQEKKVEREVRPLVSAVTSNK
jgi:addiction module HigA family antidote